MTVQPRRVQGEAIERFAQMTDWSYYEAARRFQRVLDVAGINSALRKAGIQVGGWCLYFALQLYCGCGCTVGFCSLK